MALKHNAHVFHYFKYRAFLAHHTSYHGNWLFWVRQAIEEVKF